MTSPGTRRQNAGRALLAVAAASALAASIAELAALSAASHDVAMLTGWRAFGLAVFAGVFALLAWRPQGFPGLLELAIAHKLAMTVHALSRLDTAADAGTVVAADGLLTLALVTAYLLVRGDQAWPRRAARARGPGPGQSSRAPRNTLSTRRSA